MERGSQARLNHRLNPSSATGPKTFSMVGHGWIPTHTLSTLHDVDVEHMQFHKRPSHLIEK